MEQRPYPKDAKTSNQLAWRTMYQACTDLWNSLSIAERKVWHNNARPLHQTGYSLYMSQCLRPNPGIYLPLAGGTMSGVIGMGTNKITDLAAPTNPNDAARLADAGGGTGKKIQDADADTYVDTEESADEDHVRMGTAGTEAFDLGPLGILSLAKQSAARARITSDQTIPNSTWTKLQLGTEFFDIQNEFDNVTNYRFTATNAGKYLLTIEVDLEDLADGTTLGCIIKKNGAYYSAFTSFATGAARTCSFAGADVIHLAASDYVEAFVYHNHGSNRIAEANTYLNLMSVVKVA